MTKLDEADGAARWRRRKLHSGPQPDIRLRAERRRWSEDVIKGVLALCALVSVVTTVGIVIALLEPSIEFFREISIVDFLTGTNWAPLFVPPQLRRPARSSSGTLLVTAIACLVCMPARARRGDLPERVRAAAGARGPEAGARGARRHPDGRLRLLRAHLLHAVPRRTSGSTSNVFNALSAGIVMGVMLIPTVASISEDAMASVPRDLRDGAYALGGSRLQVSTRIVVPAAISGIVASLRPRHLARDRRDDDRPDRRGRDRAAQRSTRASRSQTMTAFIARDRDRRRPDGLDRVQDDLRGRPHALRAHARHEHRRDPARAQVPRGLRMSAVPAPILGAALATRRGSRGGVFYGAPPLLDHDRVRPPRGAARGRPPQGAPVPRLRSS